MAESDFTQDFDAPVIEPVKGVGDARFKRADMDYWASWATLIRTKRLNELRKQLDAMPGIAAATKAQALAAGQSASVQMFELLDQQYTPEGIDKITKDAYERAGGDMTKWPAIRSRIGPTRLMQLAGEICSEPKPTVVELRESLRDLLRKAQKSIAGVENMNDEQLIVAVREFTPPPQQGDDENPLAGSPQGESKPEPITEPAAGSSADGLASIRAA